MEPVIGKPRKRFLHVFTLPTTRSTLVSLGFILFTGLCVLPVVYMAGVSLVNAEGSFSIENYRRLLFEHRQREPCVSIHERPSMPDSTSPQTLGPHE